MRIKTYDFVLVIDSYTKVKALQEEDQGGWQEIMRKVKTNFRDAFVC